MKLVPDTPLDNLSGDLLDRQNLVLRICDLLITRKNDSHRASRLVVGLTGKWGSGKSTVLNAVKRKLMESADIKVIEFNPWVFEGRDDLISSFLDELAKQLGTSSRDSFSKLGDAVARYGEAIGAAVNVAVPGVGTFFGKGLKLLKSDKPSVSQQRRKVETALTNLDGAIVVIIDELDRVDDEEIRAMARLVKAIADLPSISYLIGYDRDRVEEALSGTVPGRGSAYLQKVVQLPIPLRPIMDFEVRDLLATSFRSSAISNILSDEELDGKIYEIISQILDTPRDVRRLVSFYAALKSCLDEEVNGADLLAYCAIATTDPKIRDMIANRPDLFVSDPVDFSLAYARANSKKQSVSERLDAPVSPQTEKLLKFLFPIFGSQHDEDRFGRLDNRLNLMAVLYLGNPPFRVSKKATIDLWTNPKVDSFESMFLAGTLPDLLMNLARLLPISEIGYGADSFLQLTKFLATRRGREGLVAKSLINNLRDVILGFAKSDAGNKAARGIFTRLQESGDTMLTASILRNHMFSFGLVAENAPRGGATIFDRSEISALIDSEVHRYAKLVLSGDWLATPGEVSAIFAIEQSGNWTPELRATANEQILEGNNLERFAAIFVPPGWTVEANTIGRFVDEEVVREGLRVIVPSDDFHRMAVNSLADAVRVPGGDSS